MERAKTAKAGIWRELEQVYRAINKQKQMIDTFKNRMFASEVQDPAECLESPMEREIFTFLRDGFLLPQLQFKQGRYFLDFAFPDIKLAIEYDGAHHNTEARIEADIKRDEVLNEQGWNVYRIYKFAENFRLLLNWELQAECKYLQDIMYIVCGTAKSLMEETS